MLIHISSSMNVTDFSINVITVGDRELDNSFPIIYDIFAVYLLFWMSWRLRNSISIDKSHHGCLCFWLIVAAIKFRRLWLRKFTRYTQELVWLDLEIESKSAHLSQTCQYVRHFFLSHSSEIPKKLWMGTFGILTPFKHGS